MRVIDIAVPLRGVRRSANTIEPNPGFWGDTADPLETLLFDRSYVRFNGIRASAFYGLTGYVPGGNAEAIRPGLKPIKVAYDAQRDFHNYANAIVYPLFGYPRPSAPLSEHGVVHLDLPNGIYPASRELYRADSRFAYYGAPVTHFESVWDSSLIAPLFYTENNGSYGVIQHDFGPSPYFIASTSAVASVGVHAADAAKIFANIPTGHVFEDHSLGIRGWGHDYAGSEGPFSYSIKPNGFSASYVTYHQSPGYYLIRIKRNVRVIADVFASRSPGGFYPWGDSLRVLVRAQYDDIVTHYNRVGAGWILSPGVNNFSSSYTVEKEAESVFALTHAYEDDGSYGPEILTFLEKQLHYVRSLGPHLRPASAISSADAVASMQTSSNYIEASVESGEALDLVAGILDAKKGIENSHIEANRALVLGSLSSTVAKAKDINSLNVGDFLFAVCDFLADIRLQFSFGLNPSRDDAVELASLSARLRTLATVLKKTWVLRGSHRFAISDEGREIAVVVRSKLVFFPLSTDGLSVWQRLDVSGSLPTLSRIWQSLKFSFLVDYALSIGERMRVVELYLATMFLGFYYGVHTFSATYGVDDDEDFVGDGGGPVIVQGYIREITSFASDPSRETKFNYMPPRPPNVGVFLALLWKVFATLFTRFW